MSETYDPAADFSMQRNTKGAQTSTHIACVVLVTFSERYNEADVDTISTHVVFDTAIGVIQKFQAAGAKIVPDDRTNGIV